MTSPPLTVDHGMGQSTSSAADSPAKTSAAPERNPAWLGRGRVFGLNSLASLGKYDRVTCSWKTPQTSLLEGLDMFLEIWPRWGLMLAGECWELATKAPRTDDTGSGSWPTPTASLSKHGWAAIAPPDRDFKHRNSAIVQANVRAEMRTHGTFPRVELLEWLMGWPIEWTALEPLATDRFLRWLHSHGTFSAVPPMSDVELLAQDARQLILDGLIDETGRQRVEGPRKQLTDAQLDAYQRTDWYRRRLRGEVSGPLEHHRDCWARLEGASGGWPSGAEACASAECRNAQPDAVIGLAEGHASRPS